MLATNSDRYVIDLPEHHTFPIKKYRMVRDQLLAEGTLTVAELLEPPLAADDELLLVHTADYVTRLHQGTLTPKEVRRLGLPWSPKLVQRALAAVGGTLLTARNALKEGVAANLAGGTHHAYPDHGEGFCVFNDIAVAIRVLRREHMIRRALVVDLDVHQGNGTAVIFATDAETFTFSMHGAHNYPLHKETSRLDLALPDRISDEAYLQLLAQHLPQLLSSFLPDLVFYQAGVDPFEGDRLGRLGLTLAGLRQRDEYVFRQCASAGVPVAITLGGGYAQDVHDTVAGHCNTIRAACEIFG